MSWSDHRPAMLRMTASACSGVLHPCSPVRGLRTRSSECWPPFQWMTSTISAAASSISTTISVISARTSRWRVLIVVRGACHAAEPSKGAFDDPTAWKRHESFRPIGALDDFSFELRQDLRQGFLKVRPLIATIGKELFQERVHPEKGRKKQDAAIAILDIGRMNDGVQQQTQRVYENMALLALDLFVRVIAMRIDAAPPFSALFTLWLSTMAAVGLASRSPCSRHGT